MSHTCKEMTRITRHILRVLHRYQDDKTENLDYGGLLTEVVLLINELGFTPEQIGRIAANGKGLNEYHRAEPKKNTPFLNSTYDIKIWIDSRDSGLLIIKKIAAITAIVHALNVHIKVCK